MPTRGQRQAVPENQPEHLRPLRPEGHANPDLGEPPIHRVRGHAVESQRRDHQRQGAEQFREHGHDTLLTNRPVDVVGHRPKCEGEARIDADYGGADAARDLHR